MDKLIAVLKDMIGNSAQIAFLGGAGVSTESGIADFRSEGGVYDAIRQFGYAPETLLSHAFFMSDTEVFYAYYKSLLFAPGCESNPAHLALAQLEREGRLSAVVTQNIDGLHQRAGNQNVLELHGSMHRNFCMRCGRFYGPEAVAQAQGVPHCDCGGIIKPDVVLYGEGLDAELLARAVEHIRQADMLIVGGTSLAVYPAAGLIEYYRGDRLALINRTATPYDARANLVLRGSIGEVLAACVDTPRK